MGRTVTRSGRWARSSCRCQSRLGADPRARTWRLLAAYYQQLRALRPAAFLGFTVKPNIYGSAAAHALGIPVINNITGLGVVFERKGPLNRLVGGLYRVALGRSAKVFFQNRDDRDLFVGRRLVRANQVALLPGSGVDLEHFQPRPKPKRGGTTFLLAARLLWAKGVRRICRGRADRHGAATTTSASIFSGPIEPAGPSAVATSDLDRWSHEGVIDYRGSAADVRGGAGRGRLRRPAVLLSRGRAADPARGGGDGDPGDRRRQRRLPRCGQARRDRYPVRAALGAIAGRGDVANRRHDPFTSAKRWVAPGAPGWNAISAKRLFIRRIARRC